MRGAAPFRHFAPQDGALYRQAGWIARQALCAVELRRGEGFDPPAEFTLLEDRHYGATRIIILKRAS